MQYGIYDIANLFLEGWSLIKINVPNTKKIMPQQTWRDILCVHQLIQSLKIGKIALCNVLMLIRQLKFFYSKRVYFFITFIYTDTKSLLFSPYINTVVIFLGEIVLKYEGLVKCFDLKKDDGNGQVFNL